MLIDLNIEDSLYLLTSQNERETEKLADLVEYLDDHDAFQDGNKICIPFSEEINSNAIRTQIDDVLEHLGIESSTTQVVSEKDEEYERQIKEFEEFVENARLIRNNNFNEKLEAKFNHFVEVLKKEVKRPLYELQLLSAFHLAFSHHACNFSVPGAGKTSIVYGAYCYLRSLPEDDPSHVDKLLVVGPISSFDPWQTEYAKTFNEEIKTIEISGDSGLSKDDKEGHFYSQRPTELTLMAHNALPIYKNEIQSFLIKHKTMLVIDEAHKIKNPEGLWGASAITISPPARARALLTGTPLPNGYQDLYNLFQFLYPIKFHEIIKHSHSTLIDLTNRVINKNYRQGEIDELVENISPFFTRIRKKDLGLKKPTEHPPIIVEMDQSQRAIYEFIEKSHLGGSRSFLGDTLNKAKLIRLRQAATDPTLLLQCLKDTLDQGYMEETGVSSFEDNLYPEDAWANREISKFEIQVPQKYIATGELINNIQQKQKSAK